MVSATACVTAKMAAIPTIPESENRPKRLNRIPRQARMIPTIVLDFIKLK